MSSKKKVVNSHKFLFSVTHLIYFKIIYSVDSSVSATKTKLKSTHNFNYKIHSDGRQQSLYVWKNKGKKCTDKKFWGKNMSLLIKFVFDIIMHLNIGTYPEFLWSSFQKNLVSIFEDAGELLRHQLPISHVPDASQRDADDHTVIRLKRVPHSSVI